MKLFFKMEMTCCKSAGCNESISADAVGEGDGAAGFGETDAAGVGETAAFAASSKSPLTQANKNFRDIGAMPAYPALSPEQCHDGNGSCRNGFSPRLRKRGVSPLRALHQAR